MYGLERRILLHSMPRPIPAKYRKVLKLPLMGNLLSNIGVVVVCL